MRFEYSQQLTGLMFGKEFKAFIFKNAIKGIENSRYQFPVKLSNGYTKKFWGKTRNTMEKH